MFRALVLAAAPFPVCRRPASEPDRTVWRGRPGVLRQRPRTALATEMSKEAPAAGVFVLLSVCRWACTTVGQLATRRTALVPASVWLSVQGL